MDDENQYKYRRIDLATDAIRLVRLLNGYLDDSIECELFETYLSQVEGVPYEALSYTWGDSPEKYEIFINGRKALVKENLHAALLALRQPDEDRLLWIDAICIDQDNHREKGHQVGQMRQIYENAEQVVIWLGPSNHEIDLLMNVARQWDYQTRQQREAHHTKGWVDSWMTLTANETGPLKEKLTIGRRNALKELLDRPWFSRVWILQEVASAKRATILCGWKALPSRGFSLLPSLLNLYVAPHTQAVLDILPGYRRQETWWGKKQNLETLLLKFGTSKATDPRDNIYALLGIASDARASNSLCPNYEISLGHAIHNTISFLLFQDTYDPSIHPLPEIGSFPKFLRILPRLHDYILGWALQNHHDVTAAAAVSKAVVINALYTLTGVGPVPWSSPLSWILSSSEDFSRTFWAMLKRDGVFLDMRTTEDSCNRVEIQRRPDLLNFIMHHPNAHTLKFNTWTSEVLFEYAATSKDMLQFLIRHPNVYTLKFTTRTSEVLLESAIASEDKGTFRRIMLVLTSHHHEDLEESISQEIMRSEAIQWYIEHHTDTPENVVELRRFMADTMTISEWLAHYLKSPERDDEIDNVNMGIDGLFRTLCTQVKKSAGLSEYLATVLTSWRLKEKATPFWFRCDDFRWTLSEDMDDNTRFAARLGLHCH